MFCLELASVYAPPSVTGLGAKHTCKLLSFAAESLDAQDTYD